MSHRRATQLLMLIFALFSLSAVSIGLAAAQNATPITYGSVTAGNIPSANAQAIYSFSGTAGDLVNVQVLGTAATSQPTITLFDPNQQPVANSTQNDSLGLMPAGVQVVYRLSQTGSYFIVVSGTAGDFLLTLAARPAGVATPLVLNTPANVTIPMTAPSSVFTFNTDPALATTILIDANPVDLNASIEVRNGVGQVVSSLQGNVDNACISFGPSDEVDDLTVTSAPNTTGTLTITLSNAPCQLGSVPAQPPPATPQFTPVPINGACAASSPGNVNIRTGPSTAFAIASILPAQQPIPVIGINSDRTWFAVQSAFAQGWISASVVAITGPCDNLAVLPSPALPAASPTPGFPVVTVVVTVVAPSETPTTEATATVEAPTSTTAPASDTPIPPTETPLPTTEPSATATP